MSGRLINKQHGESRDYIQKQKWEYSGQRGVIPLDIDSEFWARMGGITQPNPSTSKRWGVVLELMQERPG